MVKEIKTPWDGDVSPDGGPGESFSWHGQQLLREGYIRGVEETEARYAELAEAIKAAFFQEGLAIHSKQEAEIYKCGGSQGHCNLCRRRENLERAWANLKGDADDCELA